MNIESALLKDATTKFPMFNLYRSKELSTFIPFLFEERGRTYPRSLFSVLRDAFYPNTKRQIKGFTEKTLSIIDPECLSEDPVAYECIQEMVKKSNTMYQTDDYIFKTDRKFLYVVDKGTNLPLVLQLN